MPYKPVQIVDFLVDIYSAVERPGSEWLQLVVERLLPGLDQGIGVQGYFVDASDPRCFDTSELMVAGDIDPELARAAFRHWKVSTPIAFQRRVHMFAPFGTGSTLPADAFSAEEIARSDEGHGNPEMIGVNGLDASGRGCAVAAASMRPIPLPSAKLTALWSRIAVHMATAARIHRRLQFESRDLESAAEAVIEPGGRVVHAEGDARTKLARSALRDGAIRLDRARSTRDDPERTAELWQALVGGRWSLVDEFRSGGRRYVVAVPNRPDARPRPELSARETQVLGALALGHSNKVIAYELGVSASSVATHIARAAAKLGAKSRVELMRLIAAQR